jgi:hypothetical protein
MNVDPKDAQESEQAMATLGEHYTVVEQYNHPAIELQLLKRQPDRTGQ